MDFFFPNWRTEADPGNLAETINEFKANRFDTIRVAVVDGVMDKDGEGVYDVQAFAIVFSIVEDEDKIDIQHDDCPTLAKLYYRVAPIA